MTALLEIREKMKQIYSKCEVFLLPVVKFLLAFLILNTLNGKMGYMTRLDNVAIVLIASLACSFLPRGFILLFAALFSLLHMYALSMEVALVGLCVYLVMFLLFFRFSPKDSLLVLLTPLLCSWKIPYVIPIAAGLICGPSAIISVGSGLVVYHLFHTVIGSSSTINTMGEEEAAAKVRLIVDGIVGNKVMLVMIAASGITILVVWLIRRMPIKYCWTIAMVAGVITNVITLLMGDLAYDINISVGGALLGSILALAVAKVIEFFRFCVDYSRVERVQFEDDEYYYYVKAVPKMTVAAPARTVKKINAQQMSGGSGRSVVMERTTGSGRTATGTQRTRGDYRGGKSVTIGNTKGQATDDGQEDDYEELF